MTTLNKQKVLEEYLSPEIWELALKGDVTIYSHIKTWQMSGVGSYKEMLEKLVIALSKEKKHYFDKAVELTSLQPPTPIYLNDNIPRKDV